jgi:hypothetical protein
MTSHDDAGRQTDAEGSLQEASSGGSMYYNGPAHQKMFPVTFGYPHVYWYFVAHVLGQPIGPILKSQAIQEEY